MIKVMVGFALGFFVATYGISGVATMVDNAVKFVQSANIKVETK
jgi:hypothetical protein